jgi:MFS family permease
MNQAKWALRVTFFFMGITSAASTARLAEIKANTGGSQSAFGAALMLANIGAMFGNYIGGRLTHTFGTRNVARFAICGFAIAQISYGFVNQLWQVPITAFAGGVSYSLANLGANSQGSMIQQKTGRSLMPSFHGSWSIGALFASFIAGIAAEHITPGVHILVNSLVALFGVLVAMRYLLPHAIDHMDQINNSAVQQHQEIPKEIKKLIYILALGSTLTMVAEISVGDWSTILLREDFNVPLGINTYGYTTFILMQTLGRFSVGRFIDRYGAQRVMRMCALFSGACYVAGLLIAKTVAQNSSHSALIVMCITYAILGIGLAPMVPSFNSIAGEIPGIPTARAVARLQMISALGFFIGRGIVSLITNFLGLPSALIFAASCLIAVGFIISKMHPEKLAH